MTEPETEYHYIRGQGWIPGTAERSVTVLNFERKLNVTLIARTPQPGELGQWRIDGDYYAEGGVLDLDRLGRWASNCVCATRDGSYIGTKVIPNGGVGSLNEEVYLIPGQRAIWFTIQVNEV